MDPNDLPQPIPSVAHLFVKAPRPKRPASVKWALAVFLLATVTLARGALHHWDDWRSGVIGGLSFLSVILLLFASRSKVTYWVAVLALCAVLDRGARNTLWQIQHPPPIIPEYPEVNRHVAPGFTMLLLALMVWLFCRFTFGKPSREYHGISVPRDEGLGGRDVE